MAETNDPKLDAITKALRERPLEDRVPGCGLSADAILEITDIRRKQADRELTERLEKAVLDGARFEAEASGLRRKLQDVRDAIGCTCR